MRPRLPTRSPRRRASTTPRLPSWLRCLVQLARLLIIACTLQLSSASHVLVNLVSGAGAVCIDTCDCSEDSGADEHGCPPDCGDCSCPHGRLPSLPPEVAAAIPAQLAWELHAPWSPYESGAPPSPLRSSLERPPRA
jgi:hypothetical protein